MISAEKLAAKRNLDTLEKHKKRVLTLFRRALKNISVYPAELQASIAKDLGNEYQQFELACYKYCSGSRRIDLAREVGSGARSWTEYQNVPHEIARYGKMQISKVKLQRCAKLAAEQMDRCEELYKRSLAVLDILEESQRCIIDLTSIRKAISDEIDLYRKIFNLYANGLSYREIERVCNIRNAQSRIKNGTIPKTILIYSGGFFSKDEVIARKVRVVSILRNVRKSLRLALKNNKNTSPEVAAKNRDIWRKEIANLRNVLNLYLKGIAPAVIERVLKLPASSWILKGEMPIKLSRAGSDFSRKDHSMARLISPSMAYAIGAYVASTVKFNQDRGITLQAVSQDIYQRAKENLETAFGIKLTKERQKSSLLIDIQRRKLIQDFHKVMGFEKTTDPLIPPDLIRYDGACRDFLNGFFDFANFYLSSNPIRFTISRTGPKNIMRAIAVALSYQGIFPTISEHGRSISLLIQDSQEVIRLLKLFPTLKRHPKASDLELQIDLMDPNLPNSYTFYQAVMRRLPQLNPKERLSRDKFSDLGDKWHNSDITKTKIKVISKWRNGIEPRSVKRMKLLRQLEIEMYPNN